MLVASDRAVRSRSFLVWSFGVRLFLCRYVPRYVPTS